MYICISQDKKKALYYRKSTGRYKYYIENYPTPNKYKGEESLLLLKYKTEKYAKGVCDSIYQMLDEKLEVYNLDEDIKIEKESKSKLNIIELMFLVKSCRNNKQRKYKGKFNDIVERECINFCQKYDIAIKKKSAYLELNSLYNKYIKEYILNLTTNKIDLYGFRKYKLLSDKEILDMILGE